MATRLVPDNDLNWGADIREVIARKNQLTDDVTGKVPVGQLGTGTPGAANFLRGDGTFAVPSPEAIHAVGNSGTALTLDASATAGAVKTITLNGNCTFTLTGATTGFVATLELVLTQDATGSRTVTWPSSVKWAGGTPSLTATANAVDRIVLASYNGGTTWLGDLIGKGYA